MVRLGPRRLARPVAAAGPGEPLPPAGQNHEPHADGGEWGVGGGGGERAVGQAEPAVALQNPRVVYGALFRSAAGSLTELVADPRRLGARLGFLAVLHTGGQSLALHPHVHCVVPGGGPSADGTAWVSVVPLGRLFRGKFLARLAELHARGQLTLAGSLRELAVVRPFADWLDGLRGTDWVVYVKRPFGGPERVLKYLAR